MLISTGVIAANTTPERVREILEERAAAQEKTIDPDTIVITMARPGMKIGVCEAN
jgi:hypothetical protein